jgi:hypothetical protein
MPKPMKKLLRLKKKALKAVKDVNKKTKFRSVYIIENDSDGILKHEVLVKSDQEIATMIENGRIDPKEKLFKAVLERVNKREVVRGNVI